MSSFKPLLINIEDKNFINPEDLTRLFFLYLRYSKYLDDDFAADGRSLLKYFTDNINKLSPYFWIVFDDETRKPAGFVYLDKITGDSKTLHNAEVSACFYKEFWGRFTYETAKIFFNFCFEKLGLIKIKAQIYPQNFIVKTILKKCGFKKEGYLKSETISGGKLQDIELYSLIKER